MADLEQPLLKKKVYPHCPGCKAAYLKNPDAKLPFKELAIVAALTLINVLPTSSLYPFLYFMVRDFHIAKTESNIGYYAGCLGAVFMLGRFCTGVPWGMVADRFGRKPVMIVGVGSVIVFHTLFGLSTNFWMAMVSRLLLGAFNGMLGTVKAYASEICKEKHQAYGVSIVGTIWALGLIVGPAMGGYLAQPAIKYPNIFLPGSLFDRFPYLLASLSVTILAIPVFIISFYLPETLHKHDVDVVDNKESEETQDSSTEQDIEQSSKVTLPEKRMKVEKIKRPSILRSKSMIAAITLYCITSLNDVAFTEIFSLWCVSPILIGGLSLTTTDVGQILAISGFTILIFQIWGFPPLVNRFGAVLTARGAAMIIVPLMAVLPFVPLLHGLMLFIILCLVSILKNIFAAIIFTSSFMLLNNSVRQDQRGAANGWAMSAVSLFKAIGPAWGGSVFAWSQSRQDAYILPGNQFVFFSLGVISLVVGLTTFEPFMPESIDRPVEEELE